MKRAETTRLKDKTKDKAAKEADRKIPVMEIFGPTIQGEGALTGQISYFIRTGGCPYRCTWCDQIEAVDPKLIKKHATYMTQERMLEETLKLLAGGAPGQWITLSGGDPLMWDLTRLVGNLAMYDMKIAVETQGSFIPDWLQYVDLITCSPKPPSSGMVDKVLFEVIDGYHRFYGNPNRVVLKVVIFNNEDLDFAETIKARFPNTRFFLSLGTPTVQDVAEDKELKRLIIQKYRWLADEFISRKGLWGATIGPQMHTLLYAREKGR